MKYEVIKNKLHSIKNIKTKDIDKFNKELIKNNIDVSDLKEHVLDDQLLHRTYFQVSLAQLNTIEEQLKFIEDNSALLQDWWHVDQLPQFLIKPLDFNYIYPIAKKYINSSETFLRRWGYVIFLTGLQKDINNTKKILSLIKDDDEYYVQMAEAWLLCDLAVFNSKEVLIFLSKSKIKYNILGKAIQKMCDSFRISDSDKESAKALRDNLKNN